MSKIESVVENLVYLEEETQTLETVPVSYRTESSEEVVVTNKLPSIVVMKSGNKEHIVTILSETIGHRNQISEQILCLFQGNDQKNKDGDMKLEEIRKDKHGIAIVTEFIISEI